MSSLIESFAALSPAFLNKPITASWWLTSDQHPPHRRWVCESAKVHMPVSCNLLSPSLCLNPRLTILQLYPDQFSTFHHEPSLLQFKPHYLLCDTFSTAGELQQPFIKYLKTTIMSLLQSSLGSNYLQESTLRQCSEIFCFLHRSDAISKTHFKEKCTAHIRRRQHRMPVQNSKCFFWENISVVLLQRHVKESRQHNYFKTVTIQQCRQCTNLQIWD